jgi:hypothetical protein
MATDNPPSRPPKPAKIQRFKISLNVLVQIAAFVVIAVMLNYLSFNHYKRWDFTRTHRYALSEKTKRVLAGLKKPVRVIVYFSAATEISMDVNNLLNEYRSLSNGKIELEVVDPVRNPTRATELANTYKIGQMENIVILDYNGRKKFINAIDMIDVDTSDREKGTRLIAFKGEQAITGALLEITDDKPNNLYAITGHGERDITGEDFKTINEFIERENVKVQTLNLQNTNAVPKDAGVLLVMGARYDFSEREMKLLRDYWENKGRLFILLDPDAQTQTPRLLAFLGEQGVRPDDDRILTVEKTAVAAIAALVKDVTGGFVDGSPITKNLKGVNGLFLGGTQSLTLDQTKAQAAGIRLQMLVQASQGYWGETDYNIKEGDKPPYFDPKKDYGGDEPLAVVASVEKGALARVQVDSSRMITAGNCMFMSKQSLTQENLDFAINSIDWLLDRAELIGIAPKAYNTLSLTLTESQLTNILTATMILIPSAVGVFGLAIWWKRRH